MTSKQVMERLEQTRLALKPIKSFKGKMPMINKIRSNIEFLKTYKVEDKTSILFIKETRDELEQIAHRIPERADDIKGPISAIEGRLILSGNTEI